MPHPPQIDNSDWRDRLPELITLERIIRSLGSRAQVDVPATVRHRGIDFPIYSIVIGSQDRSAPCVGIFGGVHGLERIGSQVVIAWLQTISELMSWDGEFLNRLERSRLVFMPIVNPVGMAFTRRANGNGVDLMRNSPIEAEGRPPLLLGGQRLSPLLPWYRGTPTPEGMEVESKALCDVVAREIFPSKVAMTVDVHSGFGAVDRIWFPYAKNSEPPPHIPEILAVKRLYDRSYPNHFYRIEPQSHQYSTHGDLWDWLYERKSKETGKGTYLPWTLELGSWLWLKKNPRQIFSTLGAFNPLRPHRHRRILRRHLNLFDFLHRAILQPTQWAQLEPETRRQLERHALHLWYK